MSTEMMQVSDIKQVVAHVDCDAFEAAVQFKEMGAIVTGVLSWTRVVMFHASKQVAGTIAQLAA